MQIDKAQYFCDIGALLQCFDGIFLFVHAIEDTKNVPVINVGRWYI